MKLSFNVEGQYLVALEAMAHKHGISVEREFDRCVQFGISNLFYRMNRNVRVNAETRLLKVRSNAMAEKLLELGIDPDEL
jgi:hypothetical protein